MRQVIKLFKSEIPGTPYLPENPFELHDFYDQWCNRCKHKANFLKTNNYKGCPFVAKVVDNRVDTIWVHDENGKPSCRSFKKNVKWL